MRVAVSDSLVRIVDQLAASVSGKTSPADAAAEIHQALQPLLTERRALVLDVRFTGIALGGTPAAPLSPARLKVASELIIRGVSRIGLTRDAGAGDIEVLLLALALPPAEGGALLLERLQHQQPQGVLLATAAAGAYRAAARGDADPAPAVAPVGPATPASNDGPGDRPEDAWHVTPTEWSAFELAVDDETALPPRPDPRREDVPRAGAGEPPPDSGAGGAELYSLFRVAPAPSADGSDLDRLVQALREAEHPGHVANSGAAVITAVANLIGRGEIAAAMAGAGALLDLAADETRSRPVRGAAQELLRRLDTPVTVQGLTGALEFASGDCAPVAALLVHTGPLGRAALARALGRPSASARTGAVVAALLSAGEPGHEVLEEAVVQGAAGAAVIGSVLQAVPHAGASAADRAARWVRTAAARAEPELRADAATAAARCADRALGRLIVPLLTDRVIGVRLAALGALAELGETAAVPFIGRLVVNEPSEEVLDAAIRALARLDTGDAVAILLAVTRRRQPFIGGRWLRSLKAAAVDALAGMSDPTGATDALHTLSVGPDADLAARAVRHLERRRTAER
jgi:hypothetical protein